MNVSSKDIKIFPAIKRTYEIDEVNLKSSAMTEENITNIIRSVTDISSYVISYISNVIEFVLYGYYVKIDLNAVPLTGNDIYASLDLETSTKKYVTIKGQDSATTGDSVYQGIHLTDTNPGISSSVKSLKILTKVNGVYEVPAESKQKFIRTSVRFPNEIDCGILK